MFVHVDGRHCMVDEYCISLCLVEEAEAHVLVGFFLLYCGNQSECRPASDNFCTDLLLSLPPLPLQEQLRRPRHHLMQHPQQRAQPHLHLSQRLVACP